MKLKKELRAVKEINEQARHDSKKKGDGTAEDKRIVAGNSTISEDRPELPSSSTDSPFDQQD